MKLLSAIMMAGVIGLLGCVDQEVEGPRQKGKVISDRFKSQEMLHEDEQEPLFIALLQLKKNPALMVTSTSVDGEIRLKPSQVQAVLQEQEEMIKEIKSISSEIEILYTYKMVLNALAIIAPQKYEKKISKLDVSFIEPDEPFFRPEVIQRPASVGVEIGGEEEPEATKAPTLWSSTAFIGADRVHGMEVVDKQGISRPLNGYGVKVGIIDSGIDYTHTMFGGSGSVEEYKAIDPNKTSPLFPSQRVVGGMDFAGAGFNTRSSKFRDNLPRPDGNPLDGSGHGSHVAGTVAGIGDGVNTYTGVAPGAQLFVLKVFGDKPGGSTSDTVVIAALEYAADPNGDLNPEDHLDVVNLSLGSDSGAPHSLYQRAVANLVRGGVVVVGAAGNAGQKRGYLVSSPSTISHMFSVAAGVDNSERNWKFRASEFSSFSEPSFLVAATEGSVSLPIEEADGISGPLVFVGEGKEGDIGDEVRGLLSGRVALIDRGAITFTEKLRRVQEAGAIGAVMVNNVPGEVISMSGDKVPIPAIMIRQDVGQRIKALMESEEVRITFKQDKKLEKPELVGTIGKLSSKGPRALDALLKPEVTAPGIMVISALTGTGHEGAPWNGTSMAAPHVTGVLALLKQRHPHLGPQALKAIVMNTAERMQDKEGKEYPVSWQGAGMVQAWRAVMSPVHVYEQPPLVVALEEESKKPEQPEGEEPSSDSEEESSETAPPAEDSHLLVEDPPALQERRADLSLGLLSLESPRVIFKTLEIVNHSPEDQVYSISYEGHSALRLEMPSSILVPAGSSSSLSVRITVDPNQLSPSSEDSSDEEASSLEGVTSLGQEVDGFILFKLTQEDEVELQLPLLAVVNRASRVEGRGLKVFAPSLRRSVGAEVEVTLINEGSYPGSAYLFNILGLDFRKPKGFSYQNRGCDLESTGYRVIEKDMGGSPTRFLQVAIKLFHPTTDWGRCHVAVNIDEDGDWISDQVIYGTLGDYVAGVEKAFPQLTDTFSSFHLDRKKMKEQKKKRDKGREEEEPPELDYVPALIKGRDGAPAIHKMRVYPHSSLAIVEARVDQLPQPEDGQLLLDVTVSHMTQYDVEEEDSIGKGHGAWLTVSVGEEAYLNMPEVVDLAPGEFQTVQMVKGLGRRSELLVFTPHNLFSFDGSLSPGDFAGDRDPKTLGRDFQSMILNPIFEELDWTP